MTQYMLQMCLIEILRFKASFLKYLIFAMFVFISELKLDRRFDIDLHTKYVVAGRFLEQLNEN